MGRGSRQPTVTTSERDQNGTAPPSAICGDIHTSGGGSKLQRCGVSWRGPGLEVSVSVSMNELDYAFHTAIEHPDFRAGVDVTRITPVHQSHT